MESPKFFYVEGDPNQRTCPVNPEMLPNFADFEFTRKKQTVSPCSPLLHLVELVLCDRRGIHPSIPKARLSFGNQINSARVSALLI